MIVTPDWTRPHINVDYPSHNKLIFEEWLYSMALYEKEFLKGTFYIDGLREYLPVFWTSYFVNNNYGNDLEAKQRLQDYIDSLDRSKKYWTCVQYDNGCVVDFKDLDIFIFGMSYRDESEKPDYFLPLVGQMYPHKYDVQKDVKASFIGSMTHPIRQKLMDLYYSKDGYFMSQHLYPQDEYQMILARSTFALSPIGYGNTSFRAFEAMYQGAIPVLITDKPVLYPHGIDFNKYGIVIEERNLDIMDGVLSSYSEKELKEKRKWAKDNWDKYFSYEGMKNCIIEHLKYV